MRKHVLYTFDDNDPPSLHHSKILELESLFANHILDDEKEDRSNPNFRGARAIGHFRAGNFMHDDVVAFRDFAEVVLDRINTQSETLRAERQTIPKDEFSQKSYDGLINAMEDKYRRARRLTEEFCNDFFAGMATAACSNQMP